MQKLAAIATVLFIFSSVNTITLPDNSFLSTSFTDFQANFNKKYDGSNELSYRKTIFNMNLRGIAESNAYQSDFVSGVNQFTDLTADELNSFLGLRTYAQASTNNIDRDQFPKSPEDAAKNVPIMSGEVMWGSVPPGVAGNSNDSNVNLSANGSIFNNSAFNSGFNGFSPSTNFNSNTNFNTNNNANTNSTGNTTNFNTNSVSFNSIAQNINWVSSGIITPIKNQGSCGACYAFAANGLTEALFKQKYKTDISLSEQDLINCTANTGNQGCSGGYIDKALNYVSSTGVRLSSVNPYLLRIATCAVPTITSLITNVSNLGSNVASAAVRVKNVRGVGNKSLLDLLNALQTAPVAVGIYVPQSLYQYTSGLFTINACNVKSSGNVPLNHAVLAVGYSLTGDASTGNRPYILIKNSWGSTWGMQGYFKLEMTLTDAGDGPCNITYGGYNFTANLA